MRPLLAAIAIITLLFGQVASAKPLTLCPECKVYRLKGGASAPEGGWLYSDLSQAVLMSEIDAMEKRLKNDYEYRLELKGIELDYVVETSSITRSITERKNAEIGKVKDDRIVFLENELVKANERAGGTDKILWFAIGTGAGIVIAVLSAWAYSMVAKAQAD